MSAYINVGWDLTGVNTGEEGGIFFTIPLNRWARCCYSLQTEIGDDVILSGTLTQLNRPDRVTGIAPTPVWNILSDDSGAPIDGLGLVLSRLTGYALEAVQVTTTEGEAANGRFMQQGETD